MEGFDFRLVTVHHTENESYLMKYSNTPILKISTSALLVNRFGYIIIVFLENSTKP